MRLRLGYPGGMVDRYVIYDADAFPGYASPHGSQRGNWIRVLPYGITRGQADALLKTTVKDEDDVQEG